MTRGLASLLSFLLSISSIISALPSQGPSLSTRQEDGCTSTDPEAVYDSSCWESLDLTNWLTNWKPPKICKGHDLGIGCCQENEFWSTCFLRLGMGHSGFDCSQIQVNTNNCAFSDLIASDLDPKERAQYRYILKTIFNINAYFNDWYTALQYATTQTALTIDPIIQAVNPPQSASVGISNTLTALIAGLPFIGSPIYAARIAESAAATAFVTGLKNTPGLIKALFPTGDGSQTIQIASLSIELTKLVNQIGDRINAGLLTLMNDQTAFANFASSGAFSSDPHLSIPKQLTEIDSALQLFVLSTALSANGYWGSFASFDSAKSTYYEDHWCWTNDQMVCYIDGTLFGGSIASLVSHQRESTTVETKLMGTITQWASPQLLYQSGVNCAASGQAGKSLVDVNPDGSLSFDCLNQLQECYHAAYQQTCSYNGGDCPISYCCDSYNYGHSHC